MNCKKIYKYISIIFIMLMLLVPNFVQAEDRIDGVSFINAFNTRSSGTSIVPIKLGIKKERELGDSYTWEGAEGQEKKVWKIVAYDDSSSTKYNYDRLFYCVQAGIGFTNDNNTEITEEIYAYAINMNMDNYEEIKEALMASDEEDEQSLSISKQDVYKKVL